MLFRSRVYTTCTPCGARAAPSSPAQRHAVENIINALSLNVIQDAKESTYTVSVKDVYSGDIVASNVQITGNRVYGVVNPNIDVEFDAMAGVSATWDSARKGFVYVSKDYSTVLHLADNTTVFQIN